LRIRILRTVPGYVDMRPMVAGSEYDTHEVTALSLIADGYAEPVRQVAADSRETADNPPPATPGRRPGRARKGGG